MNSDTNWQVIRGEALASLRTIRSDSVDAVVIVPSGDRIHPAEKPVALMRRLVSAVCPPGGITLDPFCGSGATGEACLLEGRRFIGIEAEPDFALLAEGRLSGVGSVGARSTVTQPSLFAPLGGD